MTRVEQTITLIRSAVLLMFVATFCAGFAFNLWAHVKFGTLMVISTGEFIGGMTAALVWFFKSRDEERTTQETADTAAKTAATTAATMAAVTTGTVQMDAAQAAKGERT